MLSKTIKLFVVSSTKQMTCMLFMMEVWNGARATCKQMVMLIQFTLLASQPVFSIIIKNVQIPDPHQDNQM